MSKLCDIFAPANRERCVKLLSKIKPLRPKPVKSFDSAVLIPLCYYDNKPAILYTKRSMSLRLHAGEVSFPGGKVDANETPVQAALRELQEEVGIPSDCVDIWGTFCPCPTRSPLNFIHPVLGFCGYFISSPDLTLIRNVDTSTARFQPQPNKHEVDFILFRSFDWLANPKNFSLNYLCLDPVLPFIGASSIRSRPVQLPYRIRTPHSLRFAMPLFGGTPSSDWPGIYGFTAIMTYQLLLCLLPAGLLTIPHQLSPYKFQRNI